MRKSVRCALRARAHTHGFRVTEGGEQFKLPHPPTPSLENNLSPKDGGTPECPLCLFQSPGLLAFHGGSTWPACSPCPVHCNPSKAAARHPMAASLPRLLFHTNSNSGAPRQAIWKQAGAHSEARNSGKNAKVEGPLTVADNPLS